ncbi:phenylalanine--tRNA ligase alpha subunit, cytoplasmic-like [Iris pallida]|uniref:Phenylalanine--tRNA ligase alpha subunit, cytoplasmic-like n=1 Tax=Iris pallida TaxID=29817 RepID=A0AAX6I204_IRIPA|nr:phenylalanine--tRNA ligase alpha subunit, cytoplasmic-like [Iris pallida]
MAAEGSDLKARAEREILGFLQTHEEIADSHQFASDVGIDHAEIESVIKSLSAFQFVDSKDIKKDRLLLTEEGKTYAANGSPEFQVFMAVPSDGISRPELEKKVGAQIFKIGSSQAIKSNWVMIKNNWVSRKPETDHAKDDVKDLLKKIEDGQVVDDKDVTMLKKRKLIVLQTSKGYSLRKGPNFAPERKKFATDLTREHIVSGEWKYLEFKDYNLDAAQEQPIQSGYLHPLLKAWCARKFWRYFFRWVSRRCQQIILSRAVFGILTHYFNHNNTLRVIHMIHFFLKFLLLPGNYLKIMFRK